MKEHEVIWLTMFAVTILCGISFSLSFLPEKEPTPVEASTIARVDITVEEEATPTATPSATPSPLPTATPTPTLEPGREEIKEYIEEVFGEHSEKAFKVLSCENASLNPKAVNTAKNIPASSRDIGVFQINEYWQKTQAKFLFNWKINVEIAHQLYTENGNSFKLWSCGKKFGI